MTEICKCGHDKIYHRKTNFSWNKNRETAKCLRKNCKCKKFEAVVIDNHTKTKKGCGQMNCGNITLCPTCEPQNNSPSSHVKLEDTPEDMPKGKVLVTNPSGTNSQQVNTQGVGDEGSSLLPLRRKPKADTFNLSSKILYNKNAKLTTMYGIIQMEHVREFIQRLKEDLKCDCGNAYRCPNCQMILKIDKLSGSELI